MSLKYMIKSPDGQSEFNQKQIHIVKITIDEDSINIFRTINGKIHRELISREEFIIRIVDGLLNHK